MVYAGIGSRACPTDVLVTMQKFGFLMAKRGHLLRSGGAEGADKAFEMGCKLGNGPCEIYLPWKGFNGNASLLAGVGKPAIDLAKRFHPAWDKLSEAAQKLMARNSYQVLGPDLKSPVNLVVCWTKDGYNSKSQRSYQSGGTGQAIEIAIANKIPVYNIKNPADLKALREMFYKKKEELNVPSAVLSVHIPSSC